MRRFGGILWVPMTLLLSLLFLAAVLATSVAARLAELCPMSPMCVRWLFCVGNLGDRLAKRCRFLNSTACTAVVVDRKRFGTGVCFYIPREGENNPFLR